MEKVIIALSGTIVGFILVWLKELLQNRAIIKLNLKYGSLIYTTNEPDLVGDTIYKRMPPEEAFILNLDLLYDIYNIGNIGTGITDICIRIRSGSHVYCITPESSLLVDNSRIDNLSFNLSPNSAYTIESKLTLYNENDYKHLFSNKINPYESNSFKIELIVEYLNDREIKLNINPSLILKT